MPPSFDTWAYAMGEAIGALKARDAALERRVSRVERKLRTAQQYLLRGLLVAALWGLAATLKLNADELGEVLAGLVRALLLKGG